MKASVYIATTVDGFIARENGSLDWLPGSDGEASSELGDEDLGFNEFMASVDVLVMGRNTYEMVLSFGKWPYGDKRVVVLSHSLNAIAQHLPDTVAVSALPPTKLYDELRDAGAKHLYIDGGITIQGFLEAGLIDEITITKIPILIGKGVPLFGPLVKDQNLRHVETRSYSSGFVQSKYTVIR